MASKSDFKAAQQRIFTRPRSESKSDQELLRKTEDDGVYPSPLNVKSIRVDRIVPDKNRPARSYCDASLAALGQSLLAHGQLVPILVQYQGDEDVFVLVDGEQRWRAAQAAGLQTLDAIILSNLTPTERYEQQVALALHQSSWRHDECAQALEAYKAMRGLADWTDVAGALGLSEATLLAHMQPAPPESAAPECDALAQATAAVRLLEAALARLQAQPGDKADAVLLVGELTERLAAERTRLQCGAPRLYEENKNQATEGAAKPVRHMPTWGQR